MSDSSRTKIGSLWIRQSRGNVEYMSGELELDGVKCRVTVFRNSFRTEANRQPHYHVYRDAVAPGAAPGGSAPLRTEPTQTEPERSIDINDDREMSRGPARW